VGRSNQGQKAQDPMLPDSGPAFGRSV